MSNIIKYIRNKFNIIPNAPYKPEIKDQKKIYNNTVSSKKPNNSVAPNISITYKKILELYKIKSINDMTDFINNTINENCIHYYDVNKFLLITHNNDNTNIMPFALINRVFIAWIRENINILKTHNNSIINMCYNLIVLTLTPNFMEESKLKTHIDAYIKYWFDKKDQDDFDLNLIKDMNIYFNKKFRN